MRVDTASRVGLYPAQGLGLGLTWYPKRYPRARGTHMASARTVNKHRAIVSAVLTAEIWACSRLRRACADAYDLIRATAERGLITADEASALDGARRLRNRVRGGVHLELCVLGMLSAEWHGSRPARS